MDVASSLRAGALVMLMAAAGCQAAGPRQGDPAGAAPRPSTGPRVVQSSPAAPVGVPLVPVPTGPVPPDRCPVTVAAGLHPSPSSSRGYGVAPLWVNLVDIAMKGDHRDGTGGFRYKLPWFTSVDGVLRVDVRRLDAHGQGVGRAMLVDGENGIHFYAGDVAVPAAGCWLVTGTIDRVSLSFVFRAG